MLQILLNASSASLPKVPPFSTINGKVTIIVVEVLFPITSIFVIRLTYSCTSWSPRCISAVRYRCWMYYTKVNHSIYPISFSSSKRCSNQCKICSTWRIGLCVDLCRWGCRYMRLRSHVLEPILKKVMPCVSEIIDFTSLHVYT